MLLTTGMAICPTHFVVVDVVRLNPQEGVARVVGFAIKGMRICFVSWLDASLLSGCELWPCSLSH